MNRLRVRVFSAVAALAVALTALVPAAAQEAGNPNFWFAGTKLIFERAIPLDGDVAVSIRDSGLTRFLTKLGATIAYQPQQRYIVVTAADHRTITFTIGSAQYSAGGVSSRATFAPFVDGNEPIVPLFALAHALYVEPVAGAGATILQPQIGALDIRTQAGRTTVVIRAATAVAYVKRIDTPTHVEFAFSGVASPLTGAHALGAGVTATITTGGVPRNPSTIVALDGPGGFSYELSAATSPYELALTLTGAPGAVAVNPPAPVLTNAPATARPVAVAPAYTPPPPPVLSGTVPPPAEPPASLDDTSPVAAPTGPAVVDAVTLQPVDDGLTIHVVLSGAAAYDWHRLADQRWYLDLHNTTLTDAGRDERPGVAAVDSVRIRQIGTPDQPIVRIAITLRGEKTVDVQTAADGLTIAATNVDAIAALKTGSGRVGSAAVGDLAPATPAPLDTPVAPATPWKFGNGSRTIVLDPGHGGDDYGTAHNGLIEKNLTIDIARRLRALLLAAGWNVQMTRDSDIDPVSQANLAAMRADGKPNPEDRAYLQTRCDVANSINARLFISIHVNYSDSPSVNGTTFYWYKPDSELLAQTLEKAVIPVAGTGDVGPRHENFYVIRHTTMPSVLIETAFISNPHDAALLRTPAFLQNMAQGIANGVKAYAGVPGAQTSRADQ
ncbi:MAG TPA: N-acetylmuramoyl-L-alanine amidase [Candidatus Lustribacter sp.]|nr:N-acetylmuramoyl-L-alanine amidase [Candidatus Lustribacter sp.]